MIDNYAEFCWRGRSEIARGTQFGSGSGRKGAKTIKNAGIHSRQENIHYKD